MMKQRLLSCVVLLAVLFVLDDVWALPNCIVAKPPPVRVLYQKRMKEARQLFAKFKEVDTSKLKTYLKKHPRDVLSLLLKDMKGSDLLRARLALEVLCRAQKPVQLNKKERAAFGKLVEKPRGALWRRSIFATLGRHKASDAELRRRLLKWLYKPGVSEKTKRQVIRLFGRLGPDSRDVVPSLLEFLNPNQSRFHSEILVTLGLIGKLSPTQIQSMVSMTAFSPVQAVRVRLLETLIRLGPSARVAIPLLIRMYPKNTSNVVRARIIQALSQLGAKTPQARSLFLQAHRRRVAPKAQKKKPSQARQPGSTPPRVAPRSPSVKRGGGGGGYYAGSGWGSETPSNPLHECAKQRDLPLAHRSIPSLVSVREAAAQALRRLQNKPSSKALLQARRKRRAKELRQWMNKRMAKKKQRLKEVLQQQKQQRQKLLQHKKQKAKERQREYNELQSRYRTMPIKELTKLLHSKSRIARRHAMDALIYAGPRALSLLPMVIKRIRTEKPSGGDSYRLLAAMGPKAIPSILPLLSLDGEVKKHLYKVLHRMGRPAGEALVQAFQKAKTNYIKTHYIEAIAGAKVSSPSILKFLHTLILAKTSIWQGEAITALLHIDPGASGWILQSYQKLSKTAKTYILYFLGETSPERVHPSLIFLLLEDKDTGISARMKNMSYQVKSLLTKKVREVLRAKQTKHVPAALAILGRLSTSVLPSYSFELVGLLPHTKGKVKLAVLKLLLTSVSDNVESKLSLYLPDLAKQLPHVRDLQQWVLYGIFLRYKKRSAFLLPHIIKVIQRHTSTPPTTKAVSRPTSKAEHKGKLAPYLYSQEMALCIQLLILMEEKAAPAVPALLRFIERHRIFDEHLMNILERTQSKTKQAVPFLFKLLQRTLKLSRKVLFPTHLRDKVLTVKEMEKREERRRQRIRELHSHFLRGVRRRGGTLLGMERSGLWSPKVVTYSFDTENYRNKGPLHETAQRWALTLLYQMGKTSAKSTPLVRRWFRHKNIDLHNATIRALGGSGKGALPFVPFFRERLRIRWLDISKRRVRYFRCLNPIPQDDYRWPKFRPKNWRELYAIADALACLGPLAKPTLPLIKKLTRRECDKTLRDKLYAASHAIDPGF